MEEEAEIIQKSWEGPERSEILSFGHDIPSTQELITAVGYLHETYKNSNNKGEVLSGPQHLIYSFCGERELFYF